MKHTYLLLFCFASLLAGAQTSSPLPYCDASFDDAQGFPVDDHISSVSFGTLSNNSNAQFAFPHYVHYNNLPVANFAKGNTYTLSVQFLTAGGCGYGVWIDYNHNNQFETSEKIAGTTGNTFLDVGATPTITQSVTIPLTAASGNTRMRVRIVEDDNYHIVTTNELPCNASASATDIMDWGETEDYTINLSTTTDADGMRNEENSTTFYPNPFSSEIVVSHPEPSSPVVLLDITGKTVFRGYPENRVISGLNDLPKGMYLLHIGQHTAKLCKE